MELASKVNASKMCPSGPQRAMQAPKVSPGEGPKLQKRRWLFLGGKKSKKETEEENRQTAPPDPIM